MRECQHTECGGALRTLPEDPALPPYVQHLECEDCEEWYLLDTEDGALEVDA